MPTAVTPLPIVNLVPNKTVLGAGDSLVMNLAINEPISNMGNLMVYALVQTPQGVWFSFVPGNGGSFAMRRGIKPAAVASVIPALNATILNQGIADSLPLGDYWFIAAVFHAGDPITLANWRDQAIYSSETTVTVR